MPCPDKSTCPVLKELCSELEWKELGAAYCDRDVATCERRRLAASGAPVPDDLLPDGRTLVTMGELEEAVA